LINTTELRRDARAASDERWNFGVNLLDIVFIIMGVSLVSRETVLPLLVSRLTPSPLAIGLIPAMYSLGFYLPQLFTANFAEGLPRKKPFVMFLGGVGERLPYLLIGLVVWWLAAPAPGLAAGAIIALLGFSALMMGVATPAWYDMIAKVIPVQRRGLWSGLGHGLGALLGVAGALVAGRVLEGWPYPQNFALLFGLAFAAMVVSWVGLALNREPASPVVKQRVSLRHYLARLPALLRRDRNYRRYLLSYGVVKLGALASGFYAVYGATRFQLSGEQVGLFTAALVGGQALMNPLWGLVADRLGHKAVLAGGAGSLALSALVTAAAGSAGWLVLTFCLLGAYLAGDTVSNMNIILEFCAPEERPTYIGLTNTLLAPVTTLAPLLGGWLASVAGYPPLFVVALLAATLGSALLILWVREPRLGDRG
jgi:MFS family permease